MMPPEKLSGSPPCQGSNDVVWILDPDQRILSCNPATEAFFGLSREKILGRRCWEVLHGTEGPDPNCPIARMLEPAQRVAGGFQLGKRWVQVSVEPMTGADGSCHGEVYIIRDLTEQKRTREAALSGEANQELEDFARAVAHDLRAPLRHVEGFLTLLDRHLEGSLDAQGRHYLERTTAAANRMALLIDALLVYTRLGRATMHRQRLDLGPLVRSVIQGCQEDPGIRPVRWVVGDLPAVQGDLVLLRQLLEHLLGNALKFTRPRPEAVIEIQPLEGLTHETGILIRDNGVGFDPAHGHKLFQVFQRLHREDEFEGTGIGLAIVQRIATRHGGRVQAENNPGQGATFSVILPAIVEYPKKACPP